MSSHQECDSSNALFRKMHINYSPKCVFSGLLCYLQHNEEVSLPRVRNMSNILLFSSCLRSRARSLFLQPHDASHFAHPPRFLTRKLLCKRWLWLGHAALGAQVYHLPKAISFSFGCGAVPGCWLPDRFLSSTHCVAARLFPTASCWYLICLYLGWFLSHPQHSQIRFDPFLLGVGTVSSNRPQCRDSFPFCFPFSVCVWLSGSRQAAAHVHRASAPAAPCSK